MSCAFRILILMARIPPGRMYKYDTPAWQVHWLTVVEVDSPLSSGLEPTNPLLARSTPRVSVPLWQSETAWILPFLKPSMMLRSPPLFYSVVYLAPLSLVAISILSGPRVIPFEKRAKRNCPQGGFPPRRSGSIIIQPVKFTKGPDVTSKSSNVKRPSA